MLTHNIRLNLNSGGNQASLTFRKGDTASHKLVISLLSGGDLIDMSSVQNARLKVIKPDLTKIFNDAEITENCITVIPSNQLTAAVGEAVCELIISGEGGMILGTPKFTVLVEDKVFEDSELENMVESADESTTASNLLSAVFKHRWNGTVLSVTSSSGTSAADLKGERGEKGERGSSFKYSDFTADQLAELKGADGVGISSIETIQNGTAGKVFRIKLTNGNETYYSLENGKDGKGVVSIEKETTSGIRDVYKISYSDGTNNYFYVTNGEKGDKGDKGDKGEQGEKGDKGDRGDKGNGIVSVTKTGTDGNVDTYTILFDSGNTSSFTVTNTNTDRAYDPTSGNAQSGTAVAEAVNMLEERIVGIAAEGGNVLTALEPEQKIISTASGKIVLYDNTDFLLYYIPLSRTADCYIVNTAKSKIEQVRYAYADTDKIFDDSSYVSSALAAGDRIKTEGSEGYFVMSISSASTDNIKVCVGSAEAKPYGMYMSEGVYLNGTQVKQVKDALSAEPFKSRVSGKKLAVIGDSITLGYKAVSQNDNGTYNGGYVTKKWYEYAAERYGFSSVAANAEIGRSFCCDGSLSARFTEKITEIPPDADVIVVFGGANDFSWSAPIGSPSDDSSDANGGITFYSAIKFVAEYLMNNYPDAEIIFMTPLPQNSGTIVNSCGMLLSDYSEAIKKMCRLYGLGCIDLNSVNRFYPYNEAWASTYMLDGVHPNDEGTDIYAMQMLRQMDGMFGE